MAGKMDYSRTSRPDFITTDKLARSGGDGGVYDMMYGSKKKKPSTPQMELEAVLRWVLFDTFEYKRLGYHKEGPNKLKEIRDFVVKYRGDNNLNEYQTLRIFKDYLLKQEVLEKHDKSKGKLSTFIIAILYNKFFPTG